MPLKWLIMAEYSWMALTVPENAWINCSDYARILNMLRCSYNNIIIVVTNVIMLEFLSARFVDPGYHFIFFEHELEHKNNES